MPDALGAALVAAVCSGCAFTYTEVGTAVPDPAGLEVGVATSEDVLARLGPPRVVRKQFDGELFSYRRFERKRRSLTILPIFVRLLHVESGEQRVDIFNAWWNFAARIRICTCTATASSRRGSSRRTAST